MIIAPTSIVANIRRKNDEILQSRTVQCDAHSEVMEGYHGLSLSAGGLRRGKGKGKQKVSCCVFFIKQLTFLRLQNPGDERAPAKDKKVKLGRGFQIGRIGH